MDNGAGIIKYSLATANEPSLMVNAVGQNKRTGKVYVGNKLKDELERGTPHIHVVNPLIRGLLHDSDLETQIWNQCISK
jgi:actin-like ATPase involved in cell morphogenesis